MSQYQIIYISCAMTEPVWIFFQVPIWSLKQITQHWGTTYDVSTGLNEMYISHVKRIWSCVLDSEVFVLSCHFILNLRSQRSLICTRGKVSFFNINNVFIPPLLFYLIDFLHEMWQRQKHRKKHMLSNLRRRENTIFSDINSSQQLFLIMLR